ncbi:hypothetical protein HK100_005944, partial [Physocladia obscura]
NDNDTLPPPLHFDPNREIRNLGVGYYRLSQEDEERKKQMDALESLRKETVGSRIAAGRVKDERKAKIEERKALLKERKKKREVGGGNGGGGTTGDLSFGISATSSTAVGIIQSQNDEQHDQDDVESFLRELD